MNEHDDCSRHCWMCREFSFDFTVPAFDGICKSQRIYTNISCTCESFKASNAEEDFEE